jgi:hypothetical protein
LDNDLSLICDIRYPSVLHSCWKAQAECVILSAVGAKLHARKRRRKEYYLYATESDTAKTTDILVFEHIIME